MQSFFNIKKENKEKKKTMRDLSIATKQMRAQRGRVEDIDPEDSKVFKKAVYEALGKENLREAKKVSYWFKWDIMEKYYKEIIDVLTKYEKEGVIEGIVDRLLVNKKAFFVDALCTGREFYRPLTWEQKLVVLTQMYKIYNHKTEELDTVYNKKYREPEEFIKVLDEGKISEWYVSSTAYCDNVVNMLENKVNVSDIMFWLQNDWKEASGDYFVKVNSSVLSRGVTVFENKHYQAFNRVFKAVFGRDLKCLVDFTGNNVEGILGRIKNKLEDNN